MKVKLILERATIEMRIKGERYRKVVEVEIPDTDNSQAEEKGVWQIVGYVEGDKKMTKDEKKDEMKNRISMAHKDPILQQGFEIICKNLAELEEENNKLLDVISNYEVKVADLEKQIEKMKCCENCKHKKSEVDRCELLMYTMNACLCKNKDKWEIKE